MVTIYMPTLARLPSRSHSSWPTYRDISTQHCGGGCWWDAVCIDYFVLVHWLFGAVWVHHERMAEQAVVFTEITHKFIENKFNTRDPHRDQPEKRWDLYGFPRMLKEGGPETADVVEGWFWLACLMDVHKPPLDTYGKFPYQNGAFPRASTPEEEEWVEKSGFFRELPPEVKNHIREDVLAGRWTPLGGGQE